MNAKKSRKYTKYAWGVIIGLFGILEIINGIYPIPKGYSEPILLFGIEISCFMLMCALYKDNRLRVYHIMSFVFINAFFLAALLNVGPLIDRVRGTNRAGTLMESPNSENWKAEFYEERPSLVKGVSRNQVSSVTFIQTPPLWKSLCRVSWLGGAEDVSVAKDRSVVAWAEKREGADDFYDLYVASMGTISAPKSCNHLFAGYSHMTKIELTNFDTVGVNNVQYMFCYCSSLKSITLANLDLGGVEKMDGMFIECPELTSVSFGNDFDASGVISMQAMFENCCDLESIENLRRSDSEVIKQVEDDAKVDMTYMFNKCEGLDEIDLSEWYISDKCDCDLMFRNTRARLKVYYPRGNNTWESMIASGIMGGSPDYHAS